DSDSSPTANDVDSSGRPGLAPPAADSCNFSPAGETAKISTLSCLSCRNFWLSSSCVLSSLAVGTAVLAPGNRCECTSPWTLPASCEGTCGMWQSAHIIGVA